MVSFVNKSFKPIMKVKLSANPVAAGGSLNQIREILRHPWAPRFQLGSLWKLLFVNRMRYPQRQFFGERSGWGRGSEPDGWPPAALQDSPFPPALWALPATPGLCLPLALCPQGVRDWEGGSLVCGESPRRVVGGHSARKWMQQAASEIPRGYLPGADFLPYHVLSPSR